MADSRPHRSGRLTANLAAAGLLIALGAGALVWQRPWESPGGQTPSSAIPADARALLVRQFQDLTDARSKKAFVAAAGDSAASRDAAADIWEARRQLGADDVAFTYRRGGLAPDRADGTTSAQVDVSWKGGSTEVLVRMKPVDDGFDLVSASRFGTNPLPLWLAGRVEVDRTSGTTVITIDGGDDDVDAGALARTAARTVHRLVPTAQGRLIVVLPAEEATTAAVLGRRSKDIAQVAAVSTGLRSLDGKPAIVLNPHLFGDMDDRAQRVVMTHEATHALTGVVRRTVELWVAEGFADHVALHGDKEPLSVSAGQILRSVKDNGAPKALPSAKDFDESTHGLSTVYESAWMAFRMLADRHGDAAVRGFYADVVAGSTVDTAARQWFGQSVAEITDDWRAYLTKSASTLS